jgi:hypothetical protein
MLPMNRRSFLKTSAGLAGLAWVGDLAFLSRLRPVSAAEAKLPAKLVQFHPEIEPLVKLLEDSPREKVLEEVAARIRKGLSYQQILAALLLAGVRNIQPRPVGFKFHAVLVVNSAHLASLASPDQDRWLPIFWAIDAFKNSQAADVREGDWAMGAVDESAIPSSHTARQAFTEAMDNWDEAAADVAIVGLARTAPAHEIFEILCRYGVRDFREIGHKQIYLANSFRTLEAIGWQHAEPVLRSLAYAMLDRNGAKENPAKADLDPDRPFRRNIELIKTINEGWRDGREDANATKAMLASIRDGSDNDCADKAIELLNRGVAIESIQDAVFDGAGELLMRAPGILSLHATTFSNAVHYAFNRCRDEQTRKLMLLQNASFLPRFRGNSKEKGIHIDSMEPAKTEKPGPAAIEEIFADMSKDKLSAARKILSYLKDGGDTRSFADAARRLIFLKGRDSHDYKFSSAVLEDYAAMSPPWRDRYLAASAFYLKGSGDKDNDLVKRIRAAVAG